MASAVFAALPALDENSGGMNPAAPPLSQQKFLSQPTLAPQSRQIWNLRNADIRAVTQAIAAVTNKSFIIDPRVQGNITLISKKPMTADELYYVFLSMLQVLGYAAVPTGNVVNIVPASEAKQMGIKVATQAHPGVGAEIVVRVVPVYHVSAAQMVPILQPLIQNWGNVSAYIPSNSLVLVGAADNLQHLIHIIHNMDQLQHNTISVVPLRYANAKKLVTVLQNLQNQVRSEGKVSNVAFAADEQNNSILISSNTSNIYAMQRLIRRLDRKPKDTGNTQVIQLKYLDAKKLAPILARIAEGSSAPLQKSKTAKDVLDVGGPTDISIEADEADNAIIMRAPQAIIINLEQVIAQLDRRPNEVLVEAIIVRVDQNLLNQLGIIWDTIDKNGNPSSPNTFAVGLNSNGNIGFLNGGSLEALVHVLYSNSNTEVLATPSVVVLNNETATIADGQNIGIINRQYSTNSTVNDNLVPFNTFERYDVTLSLKVTPRISPNRMLQLAILQKDDSLAASNATTSSTTESPANPILDVSKILTHVLVKSGDILVLGGLANNNRAEKWAKIPVLGDIPLLGYLFRYREHNIAKQDLMVFIRPIILHNRRVAEHETLQRYEYMRRQQMHIVEGDHVVPHDYIMLPHFKNQIPNLPYPEFTKRPMPEINNIPNYPEHHP